jgi:hypothetical protein
MSMCDYSLHGIKNRLAEEGETLVVHRFFSGSKGLTSPEYLKQSEKQHGLIATLKGMTAAPPDECAVCIPDGAKLWIHSIQPAFRKTHRLYGNEVATFRQLSAETSTYRDAIEFSDGSRLLLQDLQEGQSVRVLAMSSEEVAPKLTWEMTFR